MLRQIFFLISCCFLSLYARNPFCMRHEKSCKICVLKGIIVGERSFGHMKYDNQDFILGVGEKFLDCIITEIDCDSLLLENGKGELQRLRVNDSMKIGEAT